MNFGNNGNQQSNGQSNGTNQYNWFTNGQSSQTGFTFCPKSAEELQQEMEFKRFVEQNGAEPMDWEPISEQWYNQHYGPNYFNPSQQQMTFGANQSPNVFAFNTNNQFDMKTNAMNGNSVQNANNNQSTAFQTNFPPKSNPSFAYSETGISRTYPTGSVNPNMGQNTSNGFHFSPNNANTNPLSPMLNLSGDQNQGRMYVQAKRNIDLSKASTSGNQCNQPNTSYQCTNPFGNSPGMQSANTPNFQFNWTQPQHQSQSQLNANQSTDTPVDASVQNMFGTPRKA